jgi:hypothetical protein
VAIAATSPQVSVKKAEKLRRRERQTLRQAIFQV